MGVVEPVQVSLVHALAKSICAGELSFVRFTDHVCEAVGDADSIGMLRARRSSAPQLFFLTLVRAV